MKTISMQTKDSTTFQTNKIYRDACTSCDNEVKGKAMWSDVMRFMCRPCPLRLASDDWFARLITHDGVWPCVNDPRVIFTKRGHICFVERLYIMIPLCVKLSNLSQAERTPFHKAKAITRRSRTTGICFQFPVVIFQDKVRSCATDIVPYLPA